eukprot:4424192-Pleurochrysis_carterae.AAC.2
MRETMGKRGEKWRKQQDDPDQSGTACPVWRAVIYESNCIRDTSECEELEQLAERNQKNWRKVMLVRGKFGAT